MTEKRNITRQDVLLRTRLDTEGARYLKVEGSLPKDPSIIATLMTNRRIALDGCGAVVPFLRIRPNPRSRLEVSIDGDDVTISDLGEVQATAKVEPQASWRDKPMSDGTKVDSAVICTDDYQCNIIVSRGCATAGAGKHCRFCTLGPTFESDQPLASFDETLAAAGPSIEATVIAIQSGWRGIVNLSGGAQPMDRRDQWTTDIIEAVMTRFHASVDADILSELQVEVQLYPPRDFSQMEKWKSFGINSAEYDNQVMDPAYFRAVCPGRGEQQHWLEAQEAAAEIFGRGRGSVTNLVVGLEPIAGMLEGIEERISKGVYSLPLIWIPGGDLAGMRAPSADWFVEAFEKTADIYLRYADTLDVDLTEDDRWGYTRRGLSNWTPFQDEWSRRLQEMGKLPPGLPSQYGITPDIDQPKEISHVQV